MPSRFTALGGHLYLPAILSRAKTDQEQYYWLVGHLKRGVSIKQAKADVAVLSWLFTTVYPRDSASSADALGRKHLICQL